MFVEVNLLSRESRRHPDAQCRIRQCFKISVFRLGFSPQLKCKTLLVYKVSSPAEEVSSVSRFSFFVSLDKSILSEIYMSITGDTQLHGGCVFDMMERRASET